jgi:hypothetical protein
MMARSARVCARSARVPVVCTSTKVRVPENRCARNDASSAWAWEVWVSGSSHFPAKTAIDSGEKSGVR